MCCLCARCLVVKLQLTILYLGPNPLAVKSEAATRSKQALLQQWNAELHHDEARPGRHQDSGSMWCTEL